MGDMAEHWKDVKPLMKRDSEQRKDRNQANGIKTIASMGYEYELKNFNNHVVVKHKGVTVDYWPSTGKWIVRKKDKSGRGIKPLTNYLESI